MCLLGMLGSWQEADEGAQGSSMNWWLLAFPGVLSGMKDSPRAWNSPQIALSLLGRKDLSPKEFSRSYSGCGCWDFKYQRNKEPWVTRFFPLHPVIPPAVPLPWNSAFSGGKWLKEEENGKKKGGEE